MIVSQASILIDPGRIDGLLTPTFDSALRDLIPWFVVAVALLAAAVAAWSLARRVERHRPHHAASFRRLCRGLGLSPAQRHLLLRIAARSGQELPATMLISRGCFEDSISSGANPAGTTPDIDQLRHLIFGADDDPGPLVAT